MNYLIAALWMLSHGFNWFVVLLNRTFFDKLVLNRDNLLVLETVFLGHRPEMILK